MSRGSSSGNIEFALLSKFTQFAVINKFKLSLINCSLYTNVKQISQSFRIVHIPTRKSIESREHKTKRSYLNTTPR